MFNLKRMQTIQKDLGSDVYSIRTVEGQRALFRKLDEGFCIEVTSPLYLSDRGYSSVYLWRGDVHGELVRAVHRVPLHSDDVGRVCGALEQTAHRYAKNPDQRHFSEQAVYPHI